MELLIKEGEIRENTREIRRFYKEIDFTYDKNLGEELDISLDKFINENDLEGSEVEYWVRRYNESLK